MRHYGRFVHIQYNFINALITDSISPVNTEQMASAQQTLADASSGIDKMRQEIRSLADKVKKGKVRI